MSGPHYVPHRNRDRRALICMPNRSAGRASLICFQHRSGERAALICVSHGSGGRRLSSVFHIGAARGQPHLCAIQEWREGSPHLISSSVTTSSLIIIDNQWKNNKCHQRVPTRRQRYPTQPMLCCLLHSNTWTHTYTYTVCTYYIQYTGEIDRLFF
jgi:hypothetical protein